MQAAARPERDAGWTALQVMVVDDNVDAAEMLAMFLETSGHRVSIEHHALQVVNRAQALVPDVFLLDIGLPDLDGYALARQIRAVPKLAGAVLVAITGYGDEQARQEASAAGFDHHFVKPIETARLMDLLDTLAIS